MNFSAPCFLLVDDHALFRTGLGMMLGEYWPQAELRHAGDWAQVLSSAREVSPAPDLVLLDIQLPDGHGLDNLAQLQTLLPGCPILLMSAQVDTERLTQAQARGAAGLVSKMASAREIVAVVLAALAGTPTFATGSPLPRSEPIRVLEGGGQRRAIVCMPWWARQPQTPPRLVSAPSWLTWGEARRTRPSHVNWG